MLTIVLIVVTLGISWYAFDRPKLMDRLILWPPAVGRGQVDRLLTHGFIHADWQHLLFNMITLFFFGRLIEQLMAQLVGVWVFPLFYVSALVVSILPTYLKNQRNPNYLSLGASGGVSAVLFAFVMVAPWQLILVFFIPLPAVLFAVLYVGYSLWMDRRGGDRINHSAHLAGAAYGVLFMLIMRPQILQHFVSELGNPRLGF